jgi:hypothetical protein
VVIGAEGPISLDSHPLHYYSDGAAGRRKEGRLHSFEEDTFNINSFSDLLENYSLSQLRNTKVIFFNWTVKLFI